MTCRETTRCVITAICSCRPPLTAVGAAAAADNTAHVEEAGQAAARGLQAAPRQLGRRDVVARRAALRQRAPAVGHALVPGLELASNHAGLCLQKTVHIQASGGLGADPRVASIAGLALDLLGCAWVAGGAGMRIPSAGLLDAMPLDQSLAGQCCCTQCNATDACSMLSFDPGMQQQGTHQTA